MIARLVCPNCGSDRLDSTEPALVTYFGVRFDLVDGCVVADYVGLYDSRYFDDAGTGSGDLDLHCQECDLVDLTEHDLVTSELFQAAVVASRLEYLRGEIQAERISYSEIAELQGLAPHIEDGDVELLEWAGVPEGGRPTCPTSPVAPDGTDHAIVGCGSSNVRQDDAEPNLWDCLDCGIWFDPSKEEAQ